MATYFFSVLNGDDSRSSTTAQNSATPWKSLAKLQSFLGSLVAGDTVAFNSGEIFTGSLNISKTGLSSPITFTSFGTGNKPVISGFTTVTGWTVSPTTGGLYSAVVKDNSGTTVTWTTGSVVTLDGVFQPLSKMPKTNDGYYNITGGWTQSLVTPIPIMIESTASFNQNQNYATSSPPRILGETGEFVYRPFHWVLWRCLVTNQTSVGITGSAFQSIGGGNAYMPTQSGDHYGFFLQNHSHCCSQTGEWAYNGNTKTLTMFFGIGGSPTGHTIQMATVGTVIELNNSSNIIFRNLEIQGAHNYVIHSVNGTNNTIDSCDLAYSALIGVFGNGTATGWTFINNTVKFITSQGVLQSSGGTGWNISGSTFDQIGAWAGMGGSGESAQYTALKTKSSIVSASRFTNTGYIPLFFDGVCTVKHNFVSVYGFVKDDVGGIYCDSLFSSFGISGLVGSLVDSNIVMYATGSHVGTRDVDVRGHGLYADDQTNGVEYRNNTSAFNGEAGFYLHGAYNLNIHNNTFFNNSSSACTSYNDYNTSGVNGTFNFNKNIVFQTDINKSFWSTSAGSAAANTYFSTLTGGNGYYRPLNETTPTPFITQNGSFTLPTWKTFLGTPRETASISTPVPVPSVSNIRFEYNDTFAVKNINLGANYWQLSNSGSLKWLGTISLQPFTSAVLIFSSSLNAPTNARNHIYMVG